MKEQKKQKRKKRIKLRNVEVVRRMKAKLEAGVIKQKAKEKTLLLSAPDLCELLLCCDSTLRKLLAKGLPHYKLGKVYRFDEKEVLAWLKNNGAGINE
jgi:excisionase family DNA binding protein